MKKAYEELASVSLVIGNLIGPGIFLIPISLAQFGFVSMFGFIFASAGALLIASVLTHLNKYIPKTGGPYLYVKEALGEPMGFNVACSYFIAWCIGNATMILALPKMIAPLFPIFDESSKDFSLFFTLSFQLLVTWMFITSNLLGIKVVKWVQIITTILKVIPLIIIICFGFGFIHHYHFTEFNISSKSNFEAITTSSTLALWLFVGLESAIIPSNESSDHKLITRATYTGTIITAIILGLSYFILFSLIEPSQIKSMTFPFANAGAILLGYTGTVLISFCAFIATIGAINGCLLIQVKDSYGAAKDNLMPAFFAITNRHDAPVYGLLLTGAIISMILILSIHKTFVDAFNFVVLLSTVAFVIPYFLSAISDLLLTKKRESHKKILRYKIALLAAAYSFWVIIGAGKDAVFWGLLFFMSFFFFYAVFMIVRKDKQSIA